MQKFVAKTPHSGAM